jgi:tetrapyrrole methylase family protein/MazG family protein
LFSAEVGVDGVLIIVGLGPGDPRLLTRQAWAALTSGRPVRFRTLQHPAIAELPAECGRESFDSLYEQYDDFEQVYRAIVQAVLESARRPGGLVYAVPGDPTVGESTVAQLRRAGPESGLDVELVHGVSFVEPCLAALELDALDGLFVGDALALAAAHHPAFGPDHPALIGQLYSRELAADVKLTLLNQYPPEHPVYLLHAAGTDRGRVHRLALVELDRQPAIDALTALCVPALPSQASFEALQETIAHLRAPDGCPWDRQQTHQSLRPHLLGEAYEALSPGRCERNSAICCCRSCCRLRSPPRAESSAWRR